MSSASADLQDAKISKYKVSTLCMLGNFGIFYRVNFLNKYFKNTVWIQIRPDVLSGLVCAKDNSGRELTRKQRPRLVLIFTGSTLYQREGSGYGL